MFPVPSLDMSESIPFYMMGIPVCPRRRLFLCPPLPAQSSPAGDSSFDWLHRLTRFSLFERTLPSPCPRGRFGIPESPVPPREYDFPPGLQIRELLHPLDDFLVRPVGIVLFQALHLIDIHLGILVVPRRFQQLVGQLNIPPCFLAFHY